MSKVLFPLLILTIGCSSSFDYPLGAYNLRMDGMSPSQQVNFLDSLGFNSLFIRMQNAKDVVRFDEYYQSSQKTEGFKIESIYFATRHINDRKHPKSNIGKKS
ncbi:hypothetical protein [Flagellimonas sp. CMM7]|uniref:hypothetical protein n=1 Tax=Flagellimonas sp. CMM7 TaxID=2654676 RepID=UPI0013D67357|nr:hypothetical protein [Flagellimonas sp. CMM7]UII78727.1 hypothetical protein LV704_13775 [Flagellimonas sp. CMM7]